MLVELWVSAPEEALWFVAHQPPLFDLTTTEADNANATPTLALYASNRVGLSENTNAAVAYAQEAFPRRAIAKNTSYPDAGHASLTTKTKDSNAANAATTSDTIS